MFDQVPAGNKTWRSTKRDGRQHEQSKGGEQDTKGVMKNLRRVAPDLNVFTFEDSTGKYPRRANIYAHGVLQADGTALIAASDHERLTPEELLHAVGDLSEFDCVRLIVCYSANGGERSFAQRFADISRKKVKAFQWPVAIDKQVEFDFMLWGYDQHFHRALEQASRENNEDRVAFAAEHANSAIDNFYLEFRMRPVKSRPWLSSFASCNCTGPFTWKYQPRYFEPRATSPRALRYGKTPRGGTTDEV